LGFICWCFPVADLFLILVSQQAAHVEGDRINIFVYDGGGTTAATAAATAATAGCFGPLCHVLALGPLMATTTE
jgi:hypothetical protein